MTSKSVFSIFSQNPIFLLRGGIGNQLFIYSAAIRLGQIHSFKPIFQTIGIDHKECISELGMPGSFISTRNSWLYSLDRKLNQVLSRREVQEITDIFMIQKESFSIRNNTYVSGYFQTAEFAVELKNGEFFQNYIYQDPPTKLTDKFQEIQNSNATIIHIRFGDYLNASSTLGNLTSAYYNSIFEADKEIRTNPVYVMTDDFSAAKDFIRDFPDLDFRLLDEFQNSKSVEQIKFFSAANRIICANSTYSWWGAFLSVNARKIWAPFPWFKSSSMAIQTTKMYPSNFIQVPSIWK